MSTWIVIYGKPFPGWRTFTDHDRATHFATTAIADQPAEIIELPEGDQ